MKRRCPPPLPCFAGRLRRFSSILLNLLVGAGWAAAAFGAGSAAGPAAPIGLDEIRPGMRGYGLSVFREATIDTFSVEVIGVQRGNRVDGDVILIEIAGQDLETARVVQGMSGSPIFLDGRFAGALAFGWAGSLKPIAGVTPAAEMLRIPQTEPAAPGRRAGVRFETRDLLSGWSDPARTAALAADLTGRADAAVAVGSPLDVDDPWPAAADLLPALLPGLEAEETAGWICRPAGLAAAAAAPSGATPRTLEPGSACAVPLVLGDALLGAIGTVTWVQGDRVLMMGHPFLQRGPMDLPLATADIVTILPARDMSFKMGSIGEVVGAVHHDQRAGLGGRLGAVAPLIPVEVTIAESGSADRVYRFEVADDVQLAPSLVFWTLYNSLLAEGDDASLQTVRYSLEADWSGAPELDGQPLKLTGVAAGPAGVRGLAAQWMAPLTLLMNNPYEPVRIEAVRARLEVRKGLETATITGLTGPVHGLRPGQTARYRVGLQPHRGAPESLDFEVRLPANLQPGPLRLAVASAAEFFALEMQRAAGSFEVRDLPATLRLLNEPRSQDDLVVALLAPGQSLVLDGTEWKSLPASMRGFLAETDGAAPTLADFVVRRSRPTDWLLQGHAILALQILPESRPRSDERRP